MLCLLKDWEQGDAQHSMENTELADKMANLYLDGYGPDVVPGANPQPGDGPDGGAGPGGGPGGAGSGSGAGSCDVSPLSNDS
jgi:hypothetical protein